MKVLNYILLYLQDIQEQISTLLEHYDDQLLNYERNKYFDLLGNFERGYKVKIKHKRVIN